MMNEQNNDAMIRETMMKERVAEIQRQGIYVVFIKGKKGSPNYLEYDFKKNLNYLKFHKISNAPQKFHLDLFDPQDLTEITTISNDHYHLNQTHPQSDLRFYLTAPYQLQHMQSYILSKNNSVIPIHTRHMLENLNQGIYHIDLEQFLINIHCSQIHLPEKDHLPFVKQNDLNDQQNQAIRKAFSSKISFIRGAAGTGKTLTISRIVTLMASTGIKIIVGSTSDVANFSFINKIVEQIDQWNDHAQLNPEKKYIRLIIHLSLQGLAKINQKTRRFLLDQQLCDLIMMRNPYFQKNRNQIMEMIKLYQKFELNDKKFKPVYEECMKKLMKETTIAVTTTNHSLSFRSCTNYKPEVGIVDEAAQSRVENCYRFISFGIKRLICVGDENQLQPWTPEKKEKYNPFHWQMFQIAQKNKSYMTNLILQYRMHPEIAEFTSRHVYKGEVRNAITTVDQHTSNIKYFKTHPTSFIEHSFHEVGQVVIKSSIGINQRTNRVTGFGFEPPKNEYYNPFEGSLIMDFVIHIIPLEEWKNTTILTFYKRQMEEIETGLRYFIDKQFGAKYEDYGLTVKTVDAYQGGQHDYILISTVRSNPFISNPEFIVHMNRVNVALTRARKGLVVFGNSETLKVQKKIYKKKEEPNIWANFFEFSKKKNRVLDYWSLEFIMNKKNHQRAGFIDATNLKIELYGIINVLKNYDLQSLPTKIDQMEKDADYLMYLLKNMSKVDIEYKKDIKIVNNFLKKSEKSRATLRQNSKKQQKNAESMSTLESVLDFMKNFSTVNEVPEMIDFLQTILREVERLVEKSKEEMAETLIFDNLAGIIGCEVNTKIQSLIEDCYKMAELVIKEDKKNEQLKGEWVKRKIMIRFVNLLDKMIPKILQYIQYERVVN